MRRHTDRRLRALRRACSGTMSQISYETERLERRLVLSGPYILPADPLTPSAINATQQQRILDGLTGLVGWVDSASHSGPLASDLDFIRSAKTTEVAVESLELFAAPAATIQSAMVDEIVHYFGIVDPSTPSTGELVSYLSARPGITSVRGGVGGLGVQELRIDVTLATQATVLTSFYPRLDESVISFDANVPGNLTAAVSLGLTFGLNLDPELDAGESFFTRDLALDASLDVHLANVNQPVSVGFLSATSSNATLNADLDVRLNARNIDADPFGHVTLSEMNGYDVADVAEQTTLNDLVSASIPVSATVGAFIPSGAPTVTVCGGTLGSGVDSVVNADFSELQQFHNVDAGTVLSGLQQLSAWFTNLSNSDVLGVAAPFAGDLSIGTAGDLGEALNAKLVSLLSGSGFASAQSLGNLIQTVTGTNPAISYDASLNRVNYAIVLPRHVFLDKTSAFTLNLPTGPLTDLSSTAQVNTHTHTDVTFNIFLDISDGTQTIVDRIGIRDAAIGTRILTTGFGLTGNARFGFTRIGFSNASVGTAATYTLQIANSMRRGRTVSNGSYLGDLVEALADGAALPATVSSTGSPTLSMPNVTIVDNLFSAAGAAITTTVSDVAAGVGDAVASGSNTLVAMGGATFDAVQDSLVRGISVTTTILESPVGFTTNLLVATSTGLTNFGSNIATHLISGAIDAAQGTIETVTGSVATLQDMAAILSDALVDVGAEVIGSTVTVGVNTVSNTIDVGLAMGASLTNLAADYALDLATYVGYAGGAVAGLTGIDQLSTDGEPLLFNLGSVYDLDIGVGLNTYAPVIYDTSRLDLEIYTDTRNLDETGSADGFGVNMSAGRVSVAQDVNAPNPAAPATKSATLPPRAGGYDESTLEATAPTTSQTGRIKADFAVTSSATGAVLPRFTVLTTNIGSLFTSTSFPSTPDFTTLVSNLNLITNVSGLIGGLDSLFGGMGFALADQILSLPFPLIGDQLQQIENVFDDLKSSVVSAIDAAASFSAGNVELALNGVFGNPNVTMTVTNGPGGVAVDVRYDVVVHRVIHLVDVSLDTNLGVPALNATLSGGFDVDISYDIPLSFGISTMDGPYLVTGAPDELTFRVDASVSAALSGTIGFLSVDAAGSGLDAALQFTVDLKDPDLDGKLTVDELDDLLDGRIQGGNLATLFDATVDDTLPSGVSFDITVEAKPIEWLPAIAVDIVVNWPFSNSDTRGARPTVRLEDARVMVGGFFANTFGPVINSLQEVLAPVQPVIDVLEMEIGILRDMGFDDITIGDLARAYATNFDDDFLLAVLQVADWIDFINGISVSDTLTVHLGDLDFGRSDVDLFLPLPDDFDVDELTELADNLNLDALGDLATVTPGFSGQLEVTSGFQDGELAFPIIENPLSVFEVLLGLRDDVELITYDLPILKIHGGVNATYPIFPAIPIFVIDFIGQISLDAHIAVGLDTQGIVQFVESGDTEDLLQSFYISDRNNADGTGPDTPEFSVQAELGAYFGFDLSLLGEAKVGGGISIELAADLNDPNNDGKLRMGELHCLAEAMGFSGSGAVEFSAFARALFVKEEYPLARLELFDFEVPPGDCILGGENEADLADTVMVGADRVLLLNIGTRASQRDTLPGIIDERFTISESGGLLIVEAFGKRETFTSLNIARIEADASTGDDLIVIGSSVRAGIDVSLIGGDGDDSLIASGFGGNVTLSGGNGDDYLATGNANSSALGGSGADTLKGGNASDTLLGDAGNDSIAAGLGNDSIVAGTGRDSVFAGDGSDTVQLGEGNDVAYGELGNDFIDGNGGNDSIFGGDGNDTLRGFSEDDMLMGEAGVDSLVGGLGFDSLNGGVDGDYLNGSEDGDTLVGDAGADTLSDTLGDNEFDGGDGVDSITGGAGNDTIFGGANGDTIATAGGNDEISSDDGNDTIDAGAGSDTIESGNGNDTVTAGDGDDSVLAGDGADTVNGGIGNDSIFGNGGGDSLTGDEGTDSISGQNGADTIWGNAGNDTLQGGANTDILYGAADDDSANGGSGNDTIYGGAGTDTLDGSFDDDLVYGANGNDLVRGGKGRDLLYGGFGFDTIHGQEGGDLVVGWDDDDSLTGDADDDILYAGRGFDTAAGGTGHDRIFGERGNDWLYGDEGNDHIEGAEGDDALSGGSEDDTLLGQDGNDIAVGGPGNDLIHSGGAGTVTDSAVNALDGGDGDDHLVGADFGSVLGDIILGGKGNDLIEALGGPDIVDGGQGDDTVYAGEGGDSITGGDGNDSLLGEAGSDTLRGQRGHDRIDGGTGTDSLSGGDGDDLLDAFVGQSETLLGDDGNDYLIGSPDGADSIDAGNGDDRAIAQAGNDTVFGQAGDDTLEGGDGDDSMEGGAGRDALLGGKNHDKLYGHSSSGAGDDNKVDTVWGDVGDDNTALLGAGRDLLNGNGGNDLMFGEGQSDSIVSGANDLIDYGNGSTIPEAYSVPVPTSAPPISSLTPANRLKLDLNGGTTPPTRWSSLGGVDHDAGISPLDGADVSIVNLGGNLVAAWSAFSNGNHEIYVAQFDRTTQMWSELYTGSASGGGVSNNASQSSQPSLAVYTDNRGTSRLLLAWSETKADGSLDLQITQYQTGAFGVVDTLDLPGQDGHSHSPKLARTSDGFRIYWLYDGGLLQQLWSAHYVNDPVTAGAGDWQGAANLALEPAASINAFDAASGNYHHVLAYSAGIEPYRRVTVHVAIDGGFNAGTKGYSTAPLQDDSSAPTVVAYPQFNQEHFTFFAAWQKQNDHESQVEGIHFDTDFPGVPTLNPLRPRFFDDASVRTGATSLSDTVEYAIRPELAAGPFTTYIFWQHDGVRDNDNHASLYHMQGIGQGSFEERIASDASSSGIAQTDGAFHALNAAVGADKTVAWGDPGANGSFHGVRDQQFLAITTTATPADPNSIQTILNGVVPTQGVILVEAGTYNGFTIPSGKVATIRPKNPADLVVINGSVTVNASGVTLEHLTINGSVIFGPVDNVTFRNNTINSGPTDGIDLTAAANGLTVIDNFITSTSAKGIDLAFAGSGEIARNVIVAGTRGIDVNAAFDGDIERNDIVGASFGIRWNATARLFDNDIHDSGTGIQVLAAGLGATGPHRLNRIYANSTGINLVISAASAQRQHVYENTTGVTGAGTFGGTGPETGNVVERNTTGIAMSNGSVRFNRIHANDTGVIVGTNLSLTNNLITDSIITDVRTTGLTGVVVNSNTIVSNALASITIVNSGAHSLRGNVITNVSGPVFDFLYALPTAVLSDFNTLHTDGSTLIRVDGVVYSSIEAWRAQIGAQDTRSTGVTVNNRTWSRPQFVHAGTGDLRLRPLTAGLRSSGGPLRNADPSLNAGVVFNQGAHGLTTQDTPVSGLQIVLDGPLDALNLSAGQTVPISWRTLGFSGGTVEIDLYQQTANGPLFVAAIVNATANDGIHSYTSPTALAGAIFHVSRTGDAAIFDRSLDDIAGPIVGYASVLTNDNTPTLTGTVSDAAATVAVTLEGVQYSASNNGAGGWVLDGSLLPALADGIYNISVQATDSSGNLTSQLYSSGLTVDTTAPLAGFASMTTADNRPALSGTMDDPEADVVVRVNGINYPATNDHGSWTIADDAISPALTDGIYDVRVISQDAAGNISNRLFAAALRVDSTAPSVTASPLITRDTTPDIEAHVDDPAAWVEFTFNGNTYVAEHIGGRLYRVAGASLVSPLAEGSYPLAIRATDSVGNSTMTSIPAAITVDTTAPSATVAQRLTNDPTPSLSGTVSESSAAVVVRVGGISYAATNNGNGTWTLVNDVIAPALEDGAYSVTVYATDAAGNESSSLFADALRIDATRPAVTGKVFRFEWFQEVQIDFSEALIGFVNADAIIRNTAANTVVPSSEYSFSKSGTTGRWRFNVPMADGDYRITIAAGSVADAAGNTLATDVAHDFFVLAGDANRDRRVDFGDVLIFAQNYGRAGRSFSEGNFNYSSDGRVSFDDLLMLAQRYGSTLLNAANSGTSRSRSRANDLPATA